MFHLTDIPIPASLLVRALLERDCLGSHKLDIDQTRGTRLSARIDQLPVRGTLGHRSEMRQ
jgi:hypothetical protein